jgi:hypothetical protein
MRRVGEARFMGLWTGKRGVSGGWVQVWRDESRIDRSIVVGRVRRERSSRQKYERHERIGRERKGESCNVIWE